MQLNVPTAKYTKLLKLRVKERKLLLTLQKGKGL